MRLFKAQTGDTVHAYVQQKRLLYAARLIREGETAARAAVSPSCRICSFSMMVSSFHSRSSS